MVEFKLLAQAIRWTVLLDVLLASATIYAALSDKFGVAIALVAVCACLFCWQAMLFLRAKRGEVTLRVERNIRLPHYLQAAVQACHYAYLGLYYPAIWTHLPHLAIQIIFFYTMEMLLQWSRGKKWRIGFGPLPVVGSINLFLWFEPKYFFAQLLLIAGALLTKEFVRWRWKRLSSHIFNPSAVVLAAAGVFLMITKTTTATTGINHILAYELPPNFFEFMFVFGILLQVFFSTTLVTLGAVLALSLIHFTGILLLGEWPLINIFHINVFLGLNLLATDPATSPKSPVGKLIFGLTWGMSIWCCYVGLRYLELPTYYDKILTVPLVNILVPVFERVGRAIDVSFRFDKAVYIAAYTGLFILILPTLKLQFRTTGYYLEEHLAPIASPELWKSIPLINEKRLYCERHRRACEPWGFISEIRHYPEFAGKLWFLHSMMVDIDRLKNETAQDKNP